MHDLEKALSSRGYTLYPRSVRITGDGIRLFVAKNEDRKVIGLVHSKEMPVACDVQPLEAIAVPDGSITLYQMTWSLYERLRAMIGISPRTCDREMSFGTGDRLGLVTAAHLQALSPYSVFPVLAQQSPRELTKTGRTFRDVLLDAVMGVLEEGYDGSFGADADHIKDEAFLTEAMKAGYTMYTVDVSDWLQDPGVSDPGNLSEMAKTIVAQSHGRLIGNSYEVCGQRMLESALIYDRAMQKARCFVERIGTELDDFDVEISIDEGARDTTVEDHLFVAEYLHRSDVHFTSLAPKFPGRFEKGIDYVGDAGALHRALWDHVAVAKQIGGYRLSLHSGSDKFSVYPMFSEATECNLHVKTSGTSWLEAIRVIAAGNPPLLEHLYQVALFNLDESKKAYHVGITRQDFPTELPPDRMSFLARPAVRQLFHISYGVLLDDSREDIYRTLRGHEEEHYSFVANHIGRHVELLYL